MAVTLGSSPAILPNRYLSRITLHVDIALTTRTVIRNKLKIPSLEFIIAFPKMVFLRFLQ